MDERLILVQVITWYRHVYFYGTDSWLNHVKMLPCHEATMMTSSNGNIFRVTGPLCGEFTDPGEFPAQRPVTQSFDVFFDLRPNKRLSKQPYWPWKAAVGINTTRYGNHNETFTKLTQSQWTGTRETFMRSQQLGANTGNFGYIDYMQSKYHRSREVQA